jgi:replicative DNA helicase
MQAWQRKKSLVVEVSKVMVPRLFLLFSSAILETTTLRHGAVVQDSPTHTSAKVSSLTRIQLTIDKTPLYVLIDMRDKARMSRRQSTSTGLEWHHADGVNLSECRHPATAAMFRIQTWIIFSLLLQMIVDSSFWHG